MGFVVSMVITCTNSKQQESHLVTTAVQQDSSSWLPSPAEAFTMYIIQRPRDPDFVHMHAATTLSFSHPHHEPLYS
jgi:hypothetical protein